MAINTTVENINNQPTIEPRTVTGIFTKYIAKTLPLAFDESMSYYECLCALLEYLNETIVPDINNTNDGLSELQNFYLDLQNYVNTYFDNLDVQEEINNKMDEMVTTGALQEIIDNYFSDVTDRLNEQDTKINGLTENTPIFVSNTSDMINHGKIYVLTSNNHIYQYSVSLEQFYDTGAIYSSTDTGLPTFATLINPTTYSELLPDLDSATENNIYQLLLSPTGNKPLNLPVTPSNTIETLFVMKTSNNDIKQIYFSNKALYTRYKYHGQSWTSWQVEDSKNVTTIVTASNYATLLPDVNNISSTSNYFLLFSPDATSKPANLPNIPMSNNVEILTTEVLSARDIFQLLVSNQYIYMRVKYNNSWGNWFKICGTYNTLLTASNYTTYLTDLNNITENNTYGLLFGATGNKPDNLPVTPSSQLEILEHYSFGSARAYQIYITGTNIYTRWKYSNTWQNWKSLSDGIGQTLTTNYNVGKIIYVGTGETYTSLKDAVEYGVQFNNTIIYVKEGVYDLYQEFGGDTFFDEYNSNSSKGLILSNGIHLIFASNSKVVFNNTNENTNIDTRFSPFNAGTKGFTIENLTIETSRCRYCLHDERGSSTEQYKNVIKNCNFYHDSTNGGYKACIGGGLGKCGEIVIENCIFDNPTATSTDNVVSYHNNNSSTETGSKSNVIIKDNYFKHGTFRASWCGVSTPVTNFIVTNNKLNGDIIHRAEREQDIVQNTAVYSWNNITQ